MYASTEDSLDGIANNEVIRVDAKKTAENPIASGDAAEGTVRTTYTVPIEIYSDVDLRNSNSVNSIISRLEWHDTLGSTELDLGTASDDEVDELINGYMTDYLYHQILDYWNKKCMQIPSGSELVNINDEQEFEKYLADTLNGANLSVSDMDGSSMSGKIESYLDKLKAYLQEEITGYFDNVHAYLLEGDEKVAFNDNQEFETYLTNALEVMKSSLNSDLDGMIKEEQIEEYINNTKDSLYAGVLPYWEDIFLQPLDSMDESARVYFTSEQEFKDYLVDATDMWVYDIYDDDGIRTGTRISIVADYEKNSEGMSLNFKNILTGSKKDSFNIGVLEIPVKVSNEPKDNGDGTFTVKVDMSNKAYVKAMGYNSQSFETDLNYCVENGNIGIVWDGCTNCLTEEDLNQGYRESEIYAEVICEGEGEYTYGTLTPPELPVIETITIYKFGKEHWLYGGYSHVLSGAKFGLYKVVNGVEELIESAESNMDGEVIFDIEVPKKGEASVSYVVREISAPYGYIKTDEYLSFTLPNTTGSDIAKTFLNDGMEPESKQLTIEKRDKDTNDLIKDSNIRFKVEGWGTYTGQEYTWADFGSTGKMTQMMYTDMEYVITEIGFPTGYDNFHNINEPIYIGRIPTGTYTGYDYSTSNGVITIYNSKGISTKIVKKDQFTGEILDGWKFEITDTKSGDSGTYTSSSNSFVLRDGTYELTETRSPDGYEGDGKTFTLTISGAGTVNESVKIGSTTMKKVNGVYELVIENMPIIVPIQIYKKDENGKVIQSPVTMIINGEEETFTGSISKLIRYNQSVTIKETEAPEGYYLNSTSKTYSYHDAVSNINVTNERYKYKVKINKVNEAGGVISSDSTKFDLTYGEKRETRQVEFTGTYTLTLHEEDFPLVYKEVKAPDGYYKDDTEYTVEFTDVELYEASKDNVTVVEVVNEEIPYHYVNIVKVDENDDIITTDMTKFEVIGQNKLNEKYNFIGNTTVRVREDELPLTIKELEAPLGYRLSDTEYTWNVTDGDTVRVENVKVPTVDIVIEKRDSETGELIEGKAEFTVNKFRVGRSAAIDIGDGKVFYTENGKIEFTVNREDLPLSITETEEPEGYYPPGVGENHIIPASFDDTTYTLVVENIKIPDVDIVIEKRDLETGELIEDRAIFEISYFNGSRSTVGGVIAFTVKATDLPITVEELVQPEGYYPPEDGVVYTIPADARGEYTLVVENELIPFIDFSITKVDGNGDIINLPVVFSINGEEIEFTGKHEFTVRKDELPVVVKEVVAPEGYYLDTTNHVLYESNADLVAVNNIIPEREFTIVKVNDLDTEITTDSAIFRLDGNYMVDGILATSSNVEFTGNFTFTIMEDELPLTITELKSPDGHYINIEPIVVDKGSESEIRVENVRIPLVDFKIIKVDADNDMIISDGIVKVSITNTYGEKEEVEFNGEYEFSARLDKLPLTVVEIEAPEGYYFNPDSSYTMDKDNTELWIDNRMIPEKTIEIRKVDESGKIISKDVTVRVVYNKGGVEDITFNGIHHFNVTADELPLSVWEISAPDGYYIDSTVHAIGTNASTYAEFEFIRNNEVEILELSIANKVIPYIPFTLVKVDDDGKEILTGPVTFNIDGTEVTFTGRHTFEVQEDKLPVRIKEIKAPEGYYKTVSEYELYKEDTGEYKIVNSKIPHEEFTLNKVSSTDGKIINSKPTVFIIDGKEVTFTGSYTFSVRKDLLPVTLSEKTAPDGYYLSNKVVQVDTNTNKVINFENEAIPYKEFTLVKVDKNGNVINKDVTFSINGENVTFKGSYKFSVRIDQLPVTVKEVKAPTGYKVNNEVYTLNIDSASELKVVNAKSSGGGGNGGGGGSTPTPVNPTNPTDWTDLTEAFTVLAETDVALVDEPDIPTIEVPEEVKEAVDILKELEELTDADREVIEELMSKSSVTEEEYNTILKLIEDYRVPLGRNLSFEQVRISQLPKTGDNSVSWILYLLVMLAAMSGMVYLVYRRRINDSKE